MLVHSFAKALAPSSRLAVRKNPILLSLAPRRSFVSGALPRARALFGSTNSNDKQRDDGGRQQRLAGGLGIAASFAAFGTATVSSSAPDATVDAAPPSDVSGKSAGAAKLVLYQYEVCPFCNKVKAFLDYHQIPYTKVEVNPLNKAEIKFSKDYRMVPLAMVDGVQVNGSQQIIDALTTSLGVDTSNARPSTATWEKWVDDWLVHLLPPNIYRTPREALQAFDYITDQSNFSKWQQLSVRFSGAAVMFMIAKKAKAKYGLSDDARQDMLDAIEKWVTEGLTEEGAGPFHGGERPDNADLTVFGVLRAIDGDIGCRYDTWDDLKASEAAYMPGFWEWYNAMKAVVPPAVLV
jgi:microsomal prostaglandin-E synthase 2